MLIEDDSNQYQWIYRFCLFFSSSCRSFSSPCNSSICDKCQKKEEKNRKGKWWTTKTTSDFTDKKLQFYHYNVITYSKPKLSWRKTYLVSFLLNLFTLCFGFFQYITAFLHLLHYEKKKKQTITDWSSPSFKTVICSLRKKVTRETDEINNIFQTNTVFCYIYIVNG